KRRPELIPLARLFPTLAGDSGEASECIGPENDFPLRWKSMDRPDIENCKNEGNPEVKVMDKRVISFEALFQGPMKHEC
ncbi:MAG TPA: hypothetical protein VM123_05800, partial [archaeon]|nr:hypothetical protein [archaeon]